MRATHIALAAVLAALIPAAAMAQSPEAQERMRRAQEDLRQFQVQQRQQDIQQRLDDLDARIRTQQNLEALSPAGPSYQPTDLSAARAVPSVIDLSAQSAVTAAELNAENERLLRLGR